MSLYPELEGANLTTASAGRQSSRTWRLDWAAGRLRGEVDDREAAEQAVQVLMNVERFRWQIFRPETGVQWDGLVGQPPDYVAAQVSRRVEEALLMDDRITGVSQKACRIEGDSLTVELVVQTVYGDVETQLEVQLT